MTSRGGGARAAVFGVSDGLVTNVSLVLGMAGANPGGSIVRLAGVAGLVAGSFSMAAGEYLSMTAQRELMERELEVERRALERHPKGETAELRGMYVRRGIDPAVAEDMANQVMRDPELALETHAREEMGISIGRLGSPWQAAAASFVTFALGAFVPLAAVADRARGPRRSWGRSCWGRWLRSSWAWCWRRSPSGRSCVRFATVGGDRGGGGRDLRRGEGDRDRHQLTWRCGARYERSTWSTVKPSRP